MSNQNQTIDPYQYIQILPNLDGTFTRLLNDPRTLPSSDTTLPTPILTKDITVNQSNNTWVRLFLPRNAIPNNHQKLPLIVFFHGSGFVLLSAASTACHNFCAEMADTIGAVVASVEYRLAPEHRIGSCKDEWLTQHVDYCNCYVMGSSAGATIAYHAGLRVVEKVDHLEPLKIQGLILRQPFFGGTKRSGSELRFENDPVLPLCVSDLLWELAPPIGVDRNHEYCNLTVGDGLDMKLNKIREVGWRVLVSGNGGDPLVDRQKELVKLMEEKGVEVVKDFEEEGSHGVEYYEPSKGKQLIGLVKRFISSFSA